ncbi:tyrosine-type recombinase/integrase [Amycolatopsis vastitatis]|uniref:Site-specific integrase n=1 Tax=Amycolatopsis vastitatis TaxID=1905142 RepID=A0A229SVK2_9PSEU|nr:site-specific integrase [Amycolatopsis vastitatis]OXM63167.1 site-specific integrase [Amycolatopsis vastitatis]
MPRRKRIEGSRAPNGASSIYLGQDGKWHGRVTMGVLDNGKPDRRHVERKTEAEVIAAVRELERQRDAGIAPKPGSRAWTVELWLTHWVENVAAPSVRETTLAGYRVAVYKHLIPGLGAHRLRRLEPEHLEKLYAKMADAGAKPGTAHQVHRTAKTAFGVAVDRGHLTKNPAKLAKPPRVDEDEIIPLTAAEAKRVLAAARGRRNGARFVIALALGLRRGEALGLKWSRLDLDAGLLRTPRQLQRYKWKHGCGDPHRCGERLHKVAPCPPTCTRHASCPPRCPSDCVRHASSCPKRRGGGLREVDVKSKAGRRTVGIPRPLLGLLRKHKAAQDVEREFAGTEWHDGGWVFTQPTGRPIDPRADHDEWKTLLAEANVRDARLHDARHTAATMLLVLKVPLPAIMEVMGWGDASVAKRYMHVPTEVVAEIADQVENFLWSDAPPAPSPTPVVQPDAASLIDQLQRLLDAAKTSADGHDDEEPPGLRAVV